MANEAYKVKADTSIPKASTKFTTQDGREQYETVGINYAAGDYVLAEDISPPLRERAENGELDHLLEPVSGDEVEAARQASANRLKGTFIPDHEQEREILERYGHNVVPRDQELALKSAGADGARAALEAAKEQGLDTRPNLSAEEVPALNEGESVVPRGGSERQLEEVPEHVEQPPGLPVGKTLAGARGEDVEDQPRRQRPRRGGEQRTDDSEKKSE